MTKTSFQNALNDFTGARAINAPFSAIVGRRDPVGDVSRTLLGGIVLSSGPETDGWERWCGNMILVPHRIDVTRSQRSERFDQMLYFLNAGDEMWREIWRRN